MQQEVDDGDMARFIQFCADFGKSYINHADFLMRLTNWVQNDKFIKDNNWDGRRHYKVAHNKFSDWSASEFEKLLGYAQPIEKKLQEAPQPSNTFEVADSIDWREKGMVSPVGDQGLCGSDWAFTAVAAVEGAFGIQQGVFTTLSI